MIEIIAFVLLFAIPLLCCIGIIYFDDKYVRYELCGGFPMSRNTALIPWLLAIFGIGCYSLVFICYLVINAMTLYAYVVGVIAKLI